MRQVATAALAEVQTKREGDISDSFATLAGLKDQPLPDEYRLMKLSLVRGREGKIKSCWNRLLEQLRVENEVVAQRGSKVIPEIRFAHLDEDLLTAKDEIQKRGAAVVRGVIPEHEARQYKFELDDYLRKNPQTKGYPASDPQVWELYWSPAQHRARLHPNLIRTQKALMQSLWHTSPSPSPSPSPSQTHISLAHPLTYADRLRVRLPGDATFALGPHQDGGSVERWHPAGYGGADSGPYASVFAGDWESAYDPWDATARVHAVTDLHNGLGACSAFRMFQGWMSLSAVGPREGTLLVNPLLRLATAYALLRPFFRPRRTVGVGREEEEEEEEEQGEGGWHRFLEAANWEFTAGEDMTSDLQGATPGYGMEFPQWGAMHPHLELERTMVHVPRVRPGDFVVWHCDTIHAVDREHKGPGDSSVLYIPVCPATEQNANYVARMREAWRKGTPGPDFPGGKGESQHVNRPDEEFLRSVSNTEGLASFGLEPLAERVDGSEGEKETVRRVNRILGY
ncbi:unnamed protein product [Discula destructiva]